MLLLGFIVIIIEQSFNAGFRVYYLSNTSVGKAREKRLKEALNE
jgi:hypothetical protein